MEWHEMILIVAILDGPILGLIYLLWKKIK
jgi:hypothetical protein